MSTTSADPSRLSTFVSRTRPGHEGTLADRNSVAIEQGHVRSRCVDAWADVPVLSDLLRAFEGMAETDVFVTTIRDELLAADQAPSNGVVTVRDAELQAALDRAGLGKPPGPLEFQPSTGVGLPPTSGFVDDPICAANGNMVHHRVDLAFAGLAGALDLRRTYNSLVTSEVGAFGAGFSSVLDVRLRGGDDRVEIRLPDGAVAVFVRTRDGWGSAGRRLLDFKQTDAGWTVRTDHRHTYRFDPSGELAGWTVGTARVEVTRDSGGRIVSAREERSGRRLHLDWDAGCIVQAATDDGRTVSYTYDRGETPPRLVRVSGAAGPLTYEWRDGFLVAPVDADGVRPFVNEYDTDGRVVRQRSPFGRVTTYRYEVSGLTVITDRAGTRQAMVHDQRGNLTAVIDADGSAMRLTYDHADRVTRVVERDGATWHYEFDRRAGNLVRRIDPDELWVAWTWDDHGRVTSHTDRGGGVTRYHYADDPAVATPVRIVDPAGGGTEVDVDADLDRPRSVTDADGVTVRYEYDRDGQLVATIDAFGHRDEFGYDEAGQLATRADPTGTVTVLDHDPAGRLVHYDRGGITGSFTYTRAGRVCGGVEPGYRDGQRWSALFGEHGAPLTVTDAEGNTISFAYDAIGNVTAITTADDATYHQFYDEIGRSIGAADPSGATSHLHYDVRGNVVEAVDAAGRVYRRDVDAFGRTVRAIGPDGAVTRWTYHPMGVVATVTLSDGRVWATTVDESGRVTSITDPAGRVARTSYSPAGRPVERVSPAGRVEILAYDAAGRLEAVADATGMVHRFERDAAGRVVAVERDGARDEFARDGHGRVTEHRAFDGAPSGDVPTAVRSVELEYDDAGRVTVRTDGARARRTFEWSGRGLLTRATDPAGDVLEYAYDARGRLVAQTAPGGRTTTFAYDPAGRLGEIVDPTGVVTTFELDATGVVLGRRSGGSGWTSTLDEAGRVTARTDLDGTLLAEFGYDATGRTIAAGVNGHVERCLWDDADRLVRIDHDDSVTHRGGTTHIERDADGWAVGVVQPDGTELRIRRDPRGRILDIAGIPSGRHALERRDLAGRLLLGRDGTAYHYDDAGRLDRIESADGSDVRFEYGTDGLVTAEHGPAGSRWFRYDDAGRVVAATVDGVGTTVYRYDDAGRRIEEQRPDGASYGYEWVGLDRLAAITRTTATGTSRVPIECDALGRPVRVGDEPISYDPVSGLPSRLGDTAVVNTPAGAWRSDTGHLHSASGLPDGLRVGDLTFLGARVHDAATNQFLSPDPLLPVPGTPGSASGYTYAWHDPINHVDPSGKQPISREEWELIREREEQGLVGQAWAAAVEDPWGSIAMLGVLAAAGALTATGVGVIGLPMLIGAGAPAAVGFATGTFDPRTVAVGGVAGAAGGGLVSLARSTSLGLGSASVAHGVVDAAGEAANQLAGSGRVDLADVAVGGVVGAATHGIGDVVQPRTALGAVATEVTVDATSTVVESGLKGNDVGESELVIGASFSAGTGYVGHRFDDQHAARELAQTLAIARGAIDVDDDATRVYRGLDTVEAVVLDETGMVLSDAALDDRDQAIAMTGPNGMVATAEVATSTLVDQYMNDAVFTPHAVEMQPWVGG